MNTRIIELAIEALEEKRKAIAAEIAELTAQLKGGSAQPAVTAGPAARPGRRTRTAAERKAHSERMKQIWAARKAKAGKPKSAKPAVKAGHTDAANKARAEKMRAYWAERRAQKGKQTKGSKT